MARSKTSSRGSLAEPSSKPRRAGVEEGIPPELDRALRANAAARARWELLAPSHRKEYATWIASAKKDETRDRRIQQGLEKLISGQKTPMRANDAPAVSQAPVEKKLGLKEGKTLVVLDAPSSYEGPKGVAPSRPPGDIVLAFAPDTKALARIVTRAPRLVVEGGALWIAFPKKTAGIPTDLSRDHGWATIEKAGWETAGLIALDGAWSAFRFRRTGARAR